MGPSRAGGPNGPAYDVTLNVARDPQTHQWIGAGGFPVGPVIPRQFEVGPESWFDLWETPAASYLCVSHGMRWAFSVYPGTRFIPERFPPLESRVGQWSTKRLIDDLNHPGVLARDLILARELSKRDPADGELLAVFESRSVAENGALLQAIVDAGRAGRYAGAIRKYLATFRRVGAVKRLYPFPDPFKIVSEARDVDFTDAALDKLRQDPDDYGALLYAATHGATPADYRALKERPCLDDALAPACGRALREMRKRLGLDADGNPLAAK